jgi:phosphoglycerate dehydrogenase-like enzyme
VAVYDPYAKELPADIRRCATLRELFATCQIISIHCGLNDQTQDSVTRELLELLPQGGIVINTARGAIVDEAALAELVAAGRLLVGTDVIREEGHGKWPQSPLAPHPGSILTSHHIGGGKGYPPGHEPTPTLPDFVVHNLAAYRQGKPLLYVITAAEYDLKT